MDLEILVMNRPYMSSGRRLSLYLHMVGLNIIFCVRDRIGERTIHRWASILNQESIKVTTFTKEQYEEYCEFNEFRVWMGIDSTEKIPVKSNVKKPLLSKLLSNNYHSSEFVFSHEELHKFVKSDKDSDNLYEVLGKRYPRVLLSNQAPFSELSIATPFLEMWDRILLTQGMSWSLSKRQIGLFYKANSVRELQQSLHGNDNIEQLDTLARSIRDIRTTHHTVLWLSKFPDAVLPPEIFDYLQAKLERSPTFKWFNLTPVELSEKSEAWHQQILKENTENTLEATWKKTLPKLEFHIVFQGVPYAFRELTTGKELIEESAVQKNCVKSYYEKCMQGNSSIWSMSYHNMDSEVRLTVEVNPKSRSVVQVREFNNRFPDEQECCAIQEWARQVGLTGEDSQGQFRTYRTNAGRYVSMCVD